MVAHPTTLSPFPQVFFVTGDSQASYAELKLPSIERESYVPTYVFNEAMYSILSLQTSVNRYVSSCNAYGVKVALYGCLSQPSSSLDVLV